MTEAPSRPPAPVSTRPARAEDTDEVGRIQVRTWRAAYAALLPASTLDAMDPRIQGASWSRVTRPASVTRLLVAERGDRIVGFAAYGPHHEPDLDGSVGELYAIYVEPESWGTGAGHALMDDGCPRAARSRAGPARSSRCSKGTIARASSTSVRAGSSTGRPTPSMRTGSRSPRCGTGATSDAPRAVDRHGRQPRRHPDLRAVRHGTPDTCPVPLRHRHDGQAHERGPATGAAREMGIVALLRPDPPTVHRTRAPALVARHPLRPPPRTGAAERACARAR